ncbi:response regulator receiver protein [Cellulomonas bogoriensis 69B4 = DSM 16987]|uniref:Response regulator receiver protein n=1 Tax=Cellulomonas bogoriensis 69B4 = DSM 16987 TaxID=1386082 RepID=A0A0A0C1H1_9CELL|nr:response regulator receiver protein [Cellulomonas bogoriensis 69B4 = DSM 16987]
MTHHALDGYAKAAARQLGPGTHCSITLRYRDRLTYVGSSDPRAERCDAAEVVAGEGPCITAMDELRGVLVPDMQVETRWPQWREAARSVGFRSAAALPAYVDDDTTLALNMYSDALDPWDRERLIGMDSIIQEIAEAVRTRL